MAPLASRFTLLRSQAGRQQQLVFRHHREDVRDVSTCPKRVPTPKHLDALELMCTAYRCTTLQQLLTLLMAFLERPEGGGPPSKPPPVTAACVLSAPPRPANFSERPWKLRHLHRAMYLSGRRQAPERIVVEFDCGRRHVVTPRQTLGGGDMWSVCDGVEVEEKFMFRI